MNDDAALIARIRQFSKTLVLGETSSGLHMAQVKRDLDALCVLAERAAEQTTRTHEYIDLHAAAARNNAALKVRVAALEGALKEQRREHMVSRYTEGPLKGLYDFGTCNTIRNGSGECDCGADESNAWIDDALAPRRDADGAEGADG